MRTGTAEQLRWLDQTTINGDLNTGLRLMERAASGMTEAALECLDRPEGATAVAFCGPETTAATAWPAPDAEGGRCGGAGIPGGRPDQNDAGHPGKRGAAEYLRRPAGGLRSQQ